MLYRSERPKRKRGSAIQGKCVRVGISDTDKQHAAIGKYAGENGDKKKFGQLFASMHCYLVQRVIQKVFGNHPLNTTSPMSSRGLFLSRQCGRFTVSAEVQLFHTDQSDSVGIKLRMQEIKVHPLTSERLCKLIVTRINGTVYT